MNKVMSFLIALAMVFSLWGGIANAALILRGVDTLGNNLIYDTDLDITWYDFSHPGDFWPNQLDWADALSIDFGGTIFDDWRLPTTVGDPTFVGPNITTSDMGHFFYIELGGTAGSPISTSPDPDLALFNNLLDEVYWTMGDVPNSPLTEAWAFTFNTGGQSIIIFNQNTKFVALAVRSGDVGAVPVPEPSSLILLGIGAFGLIGCGRRRKRSVAVWNSEFPNVESVDRPRLLTDRSGCF